MDLSFYSLQLLEALESFYVVERDGSIIACAALFPFPEEKSGEVAAIAVSEECRGRGQGDKLLGMFFATWIIRICSLLIGYIATLCQVATTISPTHVHTFLCALSHMRTQSLNIITR